MMCKDIKKLLLIAVVLESKIYVVDHIISPQTVHVPVLMYVFSQ